MAASLDRTSQTASFRAWVYRIATNTCLDMRRQEQRRVLPQDVGPSVAPGPPTTEMRERHPLARALPGRAPAGRRAIPRRRCGFTRAVRLALVRAMQVLPARQRAALILHDVLDFARRRDRGDARDDESGDQQRAPARTCHAGRATSDRVERDATARERRDAQKAEAIARFVHAWETGDIGWARLDADAGCRDEHAAVDLLARRTRRRSPRRYERRDVAGRTAPRSLPDCAHRDERTARGARLRPDRTTDAGVALCMTVMTLEEDGRVSAMDVFHLPRHFVTWGHPPELE